MTENLVQSFISILDFLKDTPFGKELIIFIISTMPILELRGGLIAASLLNLELLPSFIICFIGNMLPIPFIIWFITPIFNYLKKSFLKEKVEKIEKRALKKQEQVSKYEFWGLLLFVGIPLPGTGAWTGALIASMINMNKKKALLACLFGVIMAGIIVSILSYGVLKAFI